MAQQAQALPIIGKPAKVLEISRKPSSLYRDAVSRFLKNRAAVTGLVIVLFFIFVAVFADPIRYIFGMPNPLEIISNNSLRLPMWQTSTNPAKTGLAAFPLGTDTIGRDVLSRALYGTRVSLIVGFIPTIVIVIVGTAIGLIAGFAGGKLDNFLMRITDVIFAFPDLLFFIIVMTALRDTWIGNLLNGLVLLFFSLAIVNWAGLARLVRGQVLSLKEKEYVEAAESIGATRTRIMLQHLLPNSLAPIIVSAAFRVPQAILTEAILGYIGVGIRPATDPSYPFPTSWGSMLLDGRSELLSQPWLLFTPAILIATILLAFNFIGDGLRDALDPMMKGRI